MALTQLTIPKQPEPLQFSGFNLLPISNISFHLFAKETFGLCRTSYIVFLHTSSFKIAFVFLVGCNDKSHVSFLHILPL